MSKHEVLLCAVQQSNNESLAHILAAAGDVKRTDDEGKTALFYAVQQSNNESVVHALINAGADVNITDNEGGTALFYAVQQSNNESVVHALIDGGANVNRTDNKGKTALFYAVQQNNNECVVRAIIECASINVDARDVYGRTPLFHAITKSVELAQLLIAKGANVHCRDNCDVSVLSFFIEDCILNKYDGLHCKINDTLALLMENGVKRKTVFKTMINVVSCQLLNVLVRYNMFRNIEQTAKTIESLCEVLELAKNYVKEEKRQERGSAIDEILQQMRNEVIVCQRIDKTVIPNVLELLVKLGANPSSADCHGNTSIHFLVQLSVFSDHESQETIHNILRKLETSVGLENFRKLKNHQHQTPFVHLFHLLNIPWTSCKDQLPLQNITLVHSVCVFLLKHGSSVEETSRTGKTVFHWILELIRQVLLKHDNPKQNEALTTLIQMFELFASQRITKGVAVNQKDANDSLNTPLHLWASLQLGPGQDYSSSIADGHTFESIMSKLLESFLKSGAQLSSKNTNDETPLHLCRTWCAFNLLIDSIKKERKSRGAVCLLNDKDSLERLPLLTAAKSKTFLQANERFFPDFSREPKEFFKTAIENNLDVCAVDKDGDSVLSILIQNESFILVEALVRAVFEQKKLSSTTAVYIINTISKEIKTDYWKSASDVMEEILQSMTSHLNLESSFQSCCKSILNRVSNFKKKKSGIIENGRQDVEHEEPPRKRMKREETVCNVEHLENSYLLDTAKVLTKNSVHFKIAQKIISHVIKYARTEEDIQSFRNIVNTADFACFQKLLLSNIKLQKSEKLPWVHDNQRYKSVLQKVARNDEECVEIADKVCFYSKHLGNGSFESHKIYAGIGIDGREVAIKHLLQANRGEKEINETQTLIKLENCQQIIRYYYRMDGIDSIYLAMELMEGNVDYYLDGKLNGIEVTSMRNIKLTEEVLKGVAFMHSRNIIHCNLNPKNLLLKFHSEREIRLKITGFELSREHRGTGSSTSYVFGPKTMKIYLAPELLRLRTPTPSDLSKKSDMFACSLSVYYILDKKGHPFCPTRYALPESYEKTENNIKNDKKVCGWEKRINPPEAKHLMQTMLHHDISKRPSAERVLKHPCFWDSKEKNKAFLRAVGNEKEFADSNYPNRGVKRKLQERFSKIVRKEKWNDRNYYPEIFTIYEELKRWREYDGHSAADLVRLFRNACEHFKSNKDIKMDVFFTCFPNLLIEVYDAVIWYNWHQDREGIKNVL